MKFIITVDLYFLIKTVRSPVVFKKRDTDDFSEPVNLHSTNSYSIDNTGIMDDTDIDFKFGCS